MAEYVGALGQGTTRNRFIIFDHDGQIVAVDQKEHKQIFPQPGWVEHNPLEIWRNTQDFIRGALAMANLTRSDLAKTVEDNGGAYFVPAFSGLFAPYWRSDARGVIVGLTRYVNKGHIARAVLEATAYQARDIVNAMNKDSGAELTSLKVDGRWVLVRRKELRQNWAKDKTWHPAMDSTLRGTYYQQWKKAVDRTFDWVD